MEKLPMDPLDIVTVIKNEQVPESALLRLEICENKIKCNDMSYKAELNQILEELKKNNGETFLSILDENNWNGSLPKALFMKGMPHLLFR